jgi:hypothetical protein
MIIGMLTTILGYPYLLLGLMLIITLLGLALFLGLWIDRPFALWFYRIVQLNPLPLYVKSVGTALEAVRDFFLHSGSYRQGYVQCLAVSAFWTLLVFLLSWATGGSGKVANADIIPPYDIWVRVPVAVVFIALCGLVVFVALQNHASGGFSGLTHQKEPFWLWLRDNTGFEIPKWVLALACFLAMFLAQVFAFDRFDLVLADIIAISPKSFEAYTPPVWVFQVGISMLGIIVVALSLWPILSTAWIICAAYTVIVAIPLLIPVPLSVALASRFTGIVPVVVLCIVVPALMAAYYAFGLQSIYLLSLIVSIPGSVALYYARNRQTGKLSALAFAGSLFPPFFITVLCSTKQINDGLAFAILVFWFILPFVNAGWDALSWVSSWELVNNIKKRAESVLTQGRSIFWFLRGLMLHVAINAILAGVLFFLVLGSLVFIVDLSNHYVGWVSRTHYVPIDGIITALREDPFTGDGLWVLLTLSSTFLPALAHLFAVMFALMAMMVPNIWIEQPAAEIKEAHMEQAGHRAGPIDWVPAARVALMFTVLGWLICAILTSIFYNLKRLLGADLALYVESTARIAHKLSSFLEF